MRKQVVLVTCLSICTACSEMTIVNMPPVFNQQSKMHVEGTNILPGSRCPDIRGMYSEPPVILTEGKTQDSTSKELTGSYYGYIPFQIAEKATLKGYEFDLSKSMFLIRQPDADNFYFAFLTQNLGVVEYHFQADEGDYQCEDGFIVFPVNKYYGTIEGMSVNYQIRNVIFRDNSAAFVIQKTIGPYRGNPSTAAKKFTYEILQYPQFVISKN